MDDAVVRAHRRRAGPHFVVERVGRRRVRRIRFVAHVVVAVDLDQADLAQLAFADHAVAGFDQVRRRPPLRADLHHALVFPRGRQHGFTFDHVHADRLLAPDVGAGFYRVDHRQRVPVVGRADKHDVQVFLRQHLAVVAVGAGLLVRCLPLRDKILRVGQHARIHVAERDYFDGIHLNEPKQIALPIPSAPDQPDA